MTARLPLILLPGLLCDAAQWRHQTQHLSDLADCRVADLTRHDSVVAMAETVLASAPERFALAGLSMGGYVALAIMRQAPQRVARLALLDTSARADTDEQRQRRFALIEMAKIGKFRGVTERLMPLLIDSSRLDDRDLTDTIKAMAENVGRDGFFRQQQAILGRRDSRDQLPAYRCKTLVMVGRSDQLTPPPLSEEMAALIPDAKLVIIENSGHLTTIEQPEAATAALRYWLQD